MRHFLIVFDGARATMRERVRSFAGAEAAMKAYAAAEGRYEGEPRIQVVLITSDSLGTVKATHPNFWSTDFATEARKALKRTAS